MFITLEDETGYVNLIVWERVWSRARRIASGSRLLEVAGMLQKEGLVTHVVAQKLVRSHRGCSGRSSRSRAISAEMGTFLVS